MNESTLRNKRERDLVPYYDAHPKYNSSCSQKYLMSTFEDVFEACGLGPKSSVLDLGCGDGRMSLPIAKQYGCSVFGYDCSEERLKLANRAAIEQGTPKAIYKPHDISDPILTMPASTKYDLVLLFETLEHIEEPRKLLDGCLQNKLVAKGKIIGSVPINMPDVAHLHVFKDKGEVEEKLGVKVIKRKGPFAFFVAE